ncbi:MAG: hypothetical protein IJY74_04530 [Oscillospiraceae bacterium]|nr:hypothetical protein [Oscillospiraceae bacterium]
MSLNIEEIMSEIRADIQEKGLTGDMLSFADIPCDANPRNRAEHFDPDHLHKNVCYISDNFRLTTDNPIDGNPVLCLFKKAVRKFIRFYAEPIAEEQSAVNANTAQAVQQLELYIQDAQAQSTASLAKRIEALELQQRSNRMEIDKLQQQVIYLSDQLQQQRKENG